MNAGLQSAFNVQSWTAEERPTSEGLAASLKNSSHDHDNTADRNRRLSAQAVREERSRNKLGSTGAVARTWLAVTYTRGMENKLPIW